MNQAEILCDIIESLDNTKKLQKQNGKPEFMEMLKSVTAKHDFNYEVMKQKVESLTHQEKVIIRYVIEGQTSKAIGDLLFISKHTVDTHRRHIIKKMDEKNFSYLRNYPAFLMFELNKS